MECHTLDHPTSHARIQQAFDAIRPERPTHLSIARPGHIAMPPGSSGDPNWHQQGIQKTARGEFVVSGSAPEVGYLYLAGAARSIVKVLTPQAATEPPDPQALNHLGGLQAAGDFLAVGYERYQNRDGGTSKILFYDIADIAAPVMLHHLTITRNRAGQTGGAVALIPLGDRWLVLVANWDAVRLDFYLSNAGDLRDPATRFSTSPLWTWSQATHGLAPGSIDNRWGWYQNVNLFGEVGATPRLEGLWFVGLYEDWADLYRLELGAGGPVVTKLGTKRFVGGVDFSQAAGLYYDPTGQAFEVYAAEAHLHDGKICLVDRWE